MTKHYIVSKEWSSDLWTYLDTQFKSSVYEFISFNGNAENYRALKKQNAKELEDYEAKKKASS
jgi:hypothetical protein